MNDDFIIGWDYGADIDHLTDRPCPECKAAGKRLELLIDYLIRRVEGEPIPMALITLMLENEGLRKELGEARHVAARANRRLELFIEAGEKFADALGRV